MTHKENIDSIINSIEENLFEYIRLLGNNEINDLYEDNKILRFTTELNIPSMESNIICKNRFSHLHGKDLNDYIEFIIKPYRDKKLPLFLLLGHSSNHHLIKKYLKKQGLMPVQKQKGMAIELEKFKIQKNMPEGTSIKKINDPLELKNWLDVYAAGFDYSLKLADFIYNNYKDTFLNKKNYFNYAVFLNNRIVATISLYITDEIAGIYNIVTIPEARQRGIARAMTEYILNEGKILGCKTGTLQATPMGVHVYNKIGFKDYCEFNLYMKLNGISKISYPASYLIKRVTNFLRKFGKI